MFAKWSELRKHAPTHPKGSLVSTFKTKLTAKTQPGQSTFFRKMSCLRWDLNTLFCIDRMPSKPTELLRQLSWLGQTTHTDTSRQSNTALINRQNHTCLLTYFPVCEVCQATFSRQRQVLSEISYEMYIYYTGALSP